MTDDEILLMAEQSVNKLCVIAVTNDDLIAFARAVAAKEREACAKIVDDETDEWESRDICAILRQVARDIRARGECDD